MAEDSSEKSSSLTKITRRDLFRKGLKVTAALGGAAVLKSELAVPTEGLETDAGIFYPLYEEHARIVNGKAEVLGLDQRDLPGELDGLFKEMAMDESDFLHPSSLLTAKVKVSGGSGKPVEAALFNESVLVALARKGAKVILGDVDIGKDLFESGHLQAEGRQATMFLGEAAVAVIYKYLLHDRSEKVRLFTRGLMSRRSWLKKSLLVAGGLLATPFLNSFASDVFGTYTGPFDKRNAGQRIFYRLSGMVAGHLSPDEHILFFRNVLMADKMLTVAENMKDQLGYKPRIAFNVGSAHTGIEDFLRAGHDFTRFILSLYPPDFLRVAIAHAGGSENFCGSKLITLPADLTFPDLRSPDLGSKLAEETIIDKPLVQILQNKLDTEAFRQEREKDTGQAKSILQKYLNPELNAKIAAVLDGFKRLKQEDYDRVMRAKYHGGSLIPDEFSITLPSGSPPYRQEKTEDLVIKIYAGQQDFTYISFFLDHNGEMVSGRSSDAVTIPGELLQSTAVRAFQDAPEQGTLWEYTPSGLKSAAIEVGTGKKQFHINQSGRLELLVWSK